MNKGDALEPKTMYPHDTFYKTLDTKLCEQIRGAELTKWCQLIVSVSNLRWLRWWKRTQTDITSNPPSNTYSSENENVGPEKDFEPKQNASATLIGKTLLKLGEDAPIKQF